MILNTLRLSEYLQRNRRSRHTKAMHVDLHGNRSILFAGMTLWICSRIALLDGICWNNYAAWQSRDARTNSFAKLFKQRAAILAECTATWERVHLFPRCNLWWIRRISCSSSWMPLWRMGTTKEQRHNKQCNCCGNLPLFPPLIPTKPPASYTVSTDSRLSENFERDLRFIAGVNCRTCSLRMKSFHETLEWKRRCG